MFNNLSEKLDKALHVLKGHGSITEINVAETLKEVRRALLDADVNYKIAKDFHQQCQREGAWSKRTHYFTTWPIDGQNCKR
jgi:signal recognition particle subunit SRP54